MALKLQLGNGKSKKDNSLNLLHGEGASSAVESAGCAYQSLSIIAVDASPQSVSLLSTFTNLVLSILLIKVPSLVEGRHQFLKRTTILLATFSAITWLPIVFVLMFFKQVDPLLLSGLWIIGLVPTTLLYPLRDNWLASLVPAEKMGRYLSWRSVIHGAFYLATFYLMGWVLNSTGGQAKSYAFVLAVAFLASTITIVLFLGVRPPVVHKSKDKAPTLTFLTFLKEARKSHLGTFIIFVSMYTFAVNLAGPLFASYMMDELKFSEMTWTAVVSCEFIARIISLTFWGKRVDRSGSLRILSVVAYFIPFVPILWLVSGNFLYLCGVQLISGTMWAAFDLCVQTFIYKATPPETRLRYIVYHRSLTSFCVALGAITGAFLLNRMFAINGSQILGLFLVSGILRMVVARVMLPRLSPQGIPEAQIHPELAAELATVPVQRMGLYYYPESWRKLSRRAVQASGNIIGRIGNIGISRNGLFYKPAKWIEYLVGNGARAEQKKAVAPATHEGLYYHKEAWTEHQKSLSAEKDASQLPLSREGLFHNPERWTDYLQQSMVMNAMIMKTGGEGAYVRQPIYYHPETWDRYQQDTARDRALMKTRAPVTKKGLLYQPEEWKKYKERTAIRKPARATVTRRALLRNPEEWKKYSESDSRKPGRVPVTIGATLTSAGKSAALKDSASVTRRTTSQAHKSALAVKPASYIKRIRTSATPA